MKKRSHRYDINKPRPDMDRNIVNINDDDICMY